MYTVHLDTLGMAHNSTLIAAMWSFHLLNLTILTQDIIYVNPSSVLNVSGQNHS